MLLTTAKRRSLLRGIIICLCCVPCSNHAKADLLPEIIVGPKNVVPACVVPDRLMQFVQARNHHLSPPREFEHKFSDVASLYKLLGQCVQKTDGKCIGIRWDYAFFQMLVETNYLLFTGGVSPNDNNFAGIGATVSGKPGEHFTSVRNGVLAHLQHVLMYAGVQIAHPIARRTGAVQDIVHEEMAHLSHPVTFTDLATLWTSVGRNDYAPSLARTAKRYSERYCSD